jgi:hypothetical protein
MFLTTYSRIISVRQDQSGFIPMILAIIFVLVSVIYLAFRRVMQVQH